MARKAKDLYAQLETIEALIKQNETVEGGVNFDADHTWVTLEAVIMLLREGEPSLE